jgi:hypothetical protein
MNLLLRRTWLPTLIFVVLATGIGLLTMPRRVLYSAGIASLLTPILWSGFVALWDRGARWRGAAAGALILGLARLLPVFTGVPWTKPREIPDGTADAMTIVGLFFGLVEACAAAVIGGVLGTILAKRRQTPSPAPAKRSG